MHRLSIAILLAIAFVSGLAASVALDRPASTSPPVARGYGSDIDTARAFYDALNQSLAGGDTEPLARLLASLYVDHDTSTGEDHDAERFLERVQARGASGAGIRFKVESIESAGNTLVVRTTNSTHLRMAGIRIERQPVTPSYELLRISNGKVLDRWSSGLQPIEVTTFDDDIIRPRGAGPISLTMQRVVIPAGAEFNDRTSLPALLMIEGGTPGLSMRSSSEDGQSLELAPGAIIAIPGATQYRIWTTDGQPVTVVAYTTSQVTPSDMLGIGREASGIQQGVAQSLLWHGTQPASESELLHQVSLLLLPPGEFVELADLPPAMLLLTSESAEIEIGAPGGAIATLGDDLWPTTRAGLARIDAEHAAWIEDAASISLRNDSDRPATIFAILIGQATQDAAVPAHSARAAL